MKAMQHTSQTPRPSILSEYIHTLTSEFRGFTLKKGLLFQYKHLVIKTMFALFYLLKATSKLVNVLGFCMKRVGVGLYMRLYNV
jgi:hypothetical protein